MRLAVRGHAQSAQFVETHAVRAKCLRAPHRPRVIPIEPQDPTDAPLAALNDQDLPPVCAQCVAHDGLCVAHARGVLPALDDAMLRRLYGLQGAKKPPKPRAPDPAVERALRREDRKRVKAKATQQAKTIDRFQRAVAGQFTRSRPASRSAA